MKLRTLPKMLLYILVPTVIGISLLATLDYRAARKAMENQIREDLQVVANRQQSDISNSVSMLQGILKNLAADASLKAFAEKLSQDAASPDLAAMRAQAETIAREVAKNFAYIKDVVVIGPAGKAVIHSAPDALNTNFSGSPLFAKAMQGESAVATLRGKNERDLLSYLGQPVVVNGKALAVLCFLLDMEKMSQNTVDTIKIAKTGVSFAYDRSGALLMHPHRAYVGDDDAKLPWVQEMQKNKNGNLDYIWNGKNKVAFFNNIPTTDWMVIVSVEKDDVLAPITAMFWNSCMVAGIIVLVVGSLIIIVAANYASVLRQGATLVQYVAAGNLLLSDEQKKGLNADCDRGDEIGALATGIRQMIDNLARIFDESVQKTHEAERAGEEAKKATIAADEARKDAENAKREGMLAAAGQLEGVVGVVTAASSDLSVRIDQSRRGSSEQAARVAETATAMEEMNSTVLEVARNAAQASDASAKTRSKAEDGAGVVQEVVASIQQVQKDSLLLKSDMETLGDNAKAISRIMGVISDIADQTNLLALNAAIEAARAGDAGRGFAVVADEVRKLAEKTMASTNDVGNAVKAIQQSAVKSAQQVDAAVQNIETATTLATRSGEALREIVSMVDGTADQVRAIATASEQQSATSEEINRSIAQVNTIAEETSGAMDKASLAVTDLAKQTQVLSGLVDDMKRG